MKKRFFSLWLCLCTVLCLCPIAVQAASTEDTAKQVFTEALGHNITWESSKDVSEGLVGRMVEINGDNQNWLFYGKFNESDDDASTDPPFIRLIGQSNLFFYNCTMDLSNYRKHPLGQDYVWFYPPVDVQSKKDVTIYIAGKCTLKGGKYCPAIFKRYAAGTLTIVLLPGAELNVEGGWAAAGIGGSGADHVVRTNNTYARVNCGADENGKSCDGRNIMITSLEKNDKTCKVNAQGGQHGAGIGGGVYGNCSSVTIAGCTVNATAGESATGIGGGTSGSAKDISFTGGTVNLASSNSSCFGGGNYDPTYTNPSPTTTNVLVKPDIGKVGNVSFPYPNGPGGAVVTNQSLAGGKVALLLDPLTTLTLDVREMHIDFYKCAHTVDHDGNEPDKPWDPNTKVQKCSFCGVQINVDTTPPVLNLVDGGHYSAPDNLLPIEATDDVSGVEGVYLYNAAATDPALQLKLLPKNNAGQYLLEVHTDVRYVVVAKDRAGNFTLQFPFTVTVTYPVTFWVDGQLIGTVDVLETDGSIPDAQIPAVPTKSGYTQVAPYWDVSDFSNITRSMSVHAVYTINTYTPVLTQGVGYTLAPVTGAAVTWGSNYSFSLTLTPGYTATQNFAVKADGQTLTPDNHGIYTISNVQSTPVVTVTGVSDTTPPTAAITLGGNSWSAFAGTVSYSLFLTNEQTLTVVPGDLGSGVAKVEYLLSDTAFKTPAEVTGTWTVLAPQSAAYTLTLKKPSRQFVYVRVTDGAGNQTIVNSEGIVIYADSTILTSVREYNADLPSDIPLILDFRGNTLKEIKNGNTVLVQDTNYVLENDKVIFRQSYLAKAFTGDSLTLLFSFNPMGATWIGNENALSAALTVKIHAHVWDGGSKWRHNEILYTCIDCGFTKVQANPDSSTGSSILTSMQEFNFDIPSDIPVTVEPGENVLKEITNGNTVLTKGTDYTLTGNTVTLRQTYLQKALTGDTLTLVFTFVPLSETPLGGDSTTNAVFTVKKHVHVWGDGSKSQQGATVYTCTGCGFTMVEVPNTGGSNPILPCTALLLLSGGGLTALTVSDRRKQRKS